MGRKKRLWSHTAGRRPYRVRVYERVRRGPLYCSVYGGSGEIRRSLGHRDRDAAISYAERESQKLRAGLAGQHTQCPTLGRGFALYREHRTIEKGAASRQEDDRQMEMWTRLLGASCDLSELSRGRLDEFVRLRSSGRIGPRGNLAQPNQAKPVRTRVVQKDLVFLRSVCHWLTGWREAEGFFLMYDPTRGYKIVSEKNPRREVATHDRVDAIRRVYGQPTMRLERGITRETV